MLRRWRGIASSAVDRARPTPESVIGSGRATPIAAVAFGLVERGVGAREQRPGLLLTRARPIDTVNTPQMPSGCGTAARCTASRIRSAAIIAWPRLVSGMISTSSSPPKR